LKILFLRETKVLEARQRLEALVIPKRQALTRLQGLLAPLLQVTQIAFQLQLKTSIFRLIGYNQTSLNAISVSNREVAIATMAAMTTVTCVSHFQQR